MTRYTGVPGLRVACYIINDHGIHALDLCHVYIATAPGRNEPRTKLFQSVDWPATFLLLGISNERSVRKMERLLNGPEPTATSYFERRELIRYALDGCNPQQAGDSLKRVFKQAGIQL